MSSNGASNQEQHLRAQLELLQNHEAGQSPRSPSSGARDSRDTSARPSNGYEDLQYTAQNAAQALKAETDSHIHPDLRASQDHSPTGTMMQLSHQEHSHSPVSAGAHPPGAPLAPAGDPMAIDSAEGRKTNKRELSQSKRAAQNRAAQRAFRQRKEGYIKKLEQQVRDFGDLEMSAKQYQAENYALRDYVIQLQTRLLGTIGEFPPPPPNVNLASGSGGPGSSSNHQGQLSSAAPAEPQQAESTTVGTPLEAVAQAVAGLAAQEQLSSEQGRAQPPYTSAAFKTDAHDEDTRTAEEINRQLNADEGTAA